MLMRRRAVVCAALEPVLIRAFVCAAKEPVLVRLVACLLVMMMVLTAELVWLMA